MGGLLPPEYRPAVVPAPAGHFLPFGVVVSMRSNQATGEIVQEGITTRPDVPFLKDILSALIFLAAASGTAVFLLL
jgi:hypothetical protein